MTNVQDPTKSGKYAVPTYRNTDFMDWWKLLNEALVKRGLGETGWKNARDCYDMGDSPETAAEQLLQSDNW